MWKALRWPTLTEWVVGAGVIGLLLIGRELVLLQIAWIAVAACVVMRGTHDDGDGDVSLWSMQAFTAVLGIVGGAVLMEGLPPSTFGRALGWMLAPLGAAAFLAGPAPHKVRWFVPLLIVGVLAAGGTVAVEHRTTPSPIYKGMAEMPAP